MTHIVWDTRAWLKETFQQVKTPFYITNEKGEGGYGGNILVYKNGSCRPATESELLLWKLLGDKVKRPAKYFLKIGCKESVKKCVSSHAGGGYPTLEAAANDFFRHSSESERRKTVTIIDATGKVYRTYKPGYRRFRSTKGKA